VLKAFGSRLVHRSDREKRAACNPLNRRRARVMKRASGRQPTPIKRCIGKASQAMRKATRASGEIHPSRANDLIGTLYQARAR